MTDMNHQEILTKAIEKAMENGWQPFEEPIENISVSSDKVGDSIQLKPYVKFEVDGESDYCFGISSIIFDHDFAKALWGTGSHEGYSYGLDDWQFHLQQMVIADDPIAYLGDNL